MVSDSADDALKQLQKWQHAHSLQPSSRCFKASTLDTMTATDPSSRSSDHGGPRRRSMNFLVSPTYEEDDSQLCPVANPRNRKSMDIIASKAMEFLPSNLDQPFGDEMCPLSKRAYSAPRPKLAFSSTETPASAILPSSGSPAFAPVRFLTPTGKDIARGALRHVSAPVYAVGNAPALSDSSKFDKVLMERAAAVRLREATRVYQPDRNPISLKRKESTIGMKLLEGRNVGKQVCVGDELSQAMAQLTATETTDASPPSHFISSSVSHSTSSGSHSTGRQPKLCSPEKTTPSIAECRTFSSAEIRNATDNFNSKQILGRGSCGSVYKGSLQGCQVAVKRMEDQEGAGFFAGGGRPDSPPGGGRPRQSPAEARANGGQGLDQLHNEIVILSKLRHPHILLLLGHCPDESCIVYEYMAGGSLHERLKVGDGPKALHWTNRVRVAAEMAGALLFMHSHSPPIIHRDLKPSNVLLNRRLECKLGDVGLAREIDKSMTLTSAGTVGYMDPDSLLTGSLSVMSDVYALGLIILQLLTGCVKVTELHKRVLGACGRCPRDVKKASDMVVRLHLDQRSGTGEWDQETAKEMCALALWCAEKSKDDRPSLEAVVFPTLQALAEKWE